jgi:hypothetical protein
MIITGMNSGALEKDKWERTIRELQDTLTDDDCIARRDAINRNDGQNSGCQSFLICGDGIETRGTVKAQTPMFSDPWTDQCHRKTGFPGN